MTARLPSEARELAVQSGFPADSFAVVERPGVPRPLVRWSSGELLVEVATSPDGRRRNLLESVGRSWADTHGVPVPQVLGVAPDGSWLLSRRLRTQVPHGPGYVRRALEVARAVRDAPALPVLPIGLDASTWRAPRRTWAARQARGLLNRVPVRLWLAARDQFRELPRDTISHGDYYPRNVLNGPRGEIAIVDWEYLGMAPRYFDEMRFWTLLAEPDDREAALEAVLVGCPRSDWWSVGALALWLAVRLLGENAKAPRGLRNETDLRHARSMVPEASRLARQLGAWPL